MSRQDPILEASWKRLVTFPIVYDELWTLYKQLEASIWTAEEINFKTDDQDWLRLTDNERQLLGSVLSFFAAADGLVMENIVENILQKVQVPEARAFYSLQIWNEAVHAETYSLLIDAIIKDPEEKRARLQAISVDPAVQLKAGWVEQNCRSENLSFAERLIAFICVEMLFFCGSFAVLFYLKKRNLFHGTTFSNELISRDESLHVRFGCLLHRHLQDQATEAFIREKITSAVEVEKVFWMAALPNPVLGMNSTLMNQYIEFIADQLLVMFDLDKMFKTLCPFDFMSLSDLEGKSNFFERRVGDYRRAKINDDTRFEFVTTADF